MRDKSAAASPAAPQPTAARKSGSRRHVDPENWDHRLGFLMHDVSRLRRTVFDDFMKPLGVTRSQWWVLAHLSRHDGMIQSDLANVLDLGKAALGGLVDRLEAAGLIERRPDDIDRRAKRVYLSPKGIQLIADMRGKSYEMSEQILAGLDLEARRALTDMLLQVKTNLTRMREGGGRADPD